MSESRRSLLRLARTLHVYLTMFSSIVLFVFALSGFMLNHKSWFGLEGGASGGRQRPAATQGSAEQPSTQRGGVPPDRIMLLSLPRRRRLGLIAMGAGTVAALCVYLFVIP